LAVACAELARRCEVRRQALEEWNMQRSEQVLEWQQQARIETMRANLLKALQVRLHAEVPEDLVSAVEAMTDLGELSRWFELALTADSLDAFRARVQVPTTNGPRS
jgi:hypothetical protein